MSYPNDDGMSRQRIIRSCRAGEPLNLIRDYGNVYDQGAIMIMRLNGQQIGWVPRDVSRGGDPTGLAHGMDVGTRYWCRISSIDGGDILYWGVGIEISTVGFTDEVVASGEADKAGYWLVFLVMVAAVISVLIFGGK